MGKRMQVANEAKHIFSPPPSWTGLYLAVWISRPRVTFDFALSDWLSLWKEKKLTVGGQRKTNEKLEIPEVKIARSGMSEKLWPWFFEVQWSLWQDREGVSSERRGLWAVSQVICFWMLTYINTSKFWPVCILTKCDKQWFETCGHAAHRTGCWVGSNLQGGSKGPEMTRPKLLPEMGPGELLGFGTGKQHVALAKPHTLSLLGTVVFWH